jgi:hypothetical protein
MDGGQSGASAALGRRVRTGQVTSTHSSQYRTAARLGYVKIKAKASDHRLWAVAAVRSACPEYIEACCSSQKYEVT